MRRDDGRLRRNVSDAVFWCGLIPIGVLTVPALLLIGLAGLLWKVLDRLLRLLDRTR